MQKGLSLFVRKRHFYVPWDLKKEWHKKFSAISGVDHSLLSVRILGIAGINSNLRLLTRGVAAATLCVHTHRKD